MNRKHTEDPAFAMQMRAAQSGDTRAYVELLKNITPLVRRIIKNQRKFLQPADVEDLVQDVLLSLHAVRSTYDSRRPFMPWLIAIVQQRLADGARRYARRGAREALVEEVPVTLPDETANIEAEGYGDAEALKQTIQDLPRGQREAIEMLKLREMSLKEAAAASGISVGALKVSVHRAMTKLRSALKR